MPCSRFFVDGDGAAKDQAWRNLPRYHRRRSIVHANGCASYFCDIACHIQARFTPGFDIAGPINAVLQVQVDMEASGKRRSIWPLQVSLDMLKQ